MKLTTLLALILTTASGLSDFHHMRNCVTSVRVFVSDGGEPIEWLRTKARGDDDTVLLYLLRLCYFYQTDKAGVPYDMPALYSRHKESVASFTDEEFALLSEVIRQEAITGIPYTEHGPLTDTTDFGLDYMKLVLPFLTGMALVVPFIWTRRYRGIKSD